MISPKHFRSTATGITLLVGLLAGCGSTSSRTGNNAPAQPTSTTKLQVVTTFLPMTQFTRAVAGERAEVSQLLPPNAEPHDYQAKPEDVRRLANAQVLVTNGLGMEEFLASTIKNAENPKLRIVDSSRGVVTLTSEAVTETAGSDHNHAHEHGELNPHIWLDPKRAIKQVENIRDGLIAADPEGKPVYTANAAQFISELKTLDAEITTSLKAYSGKTFIAYHDFAPYFAQSYGLKAEFLVNLPQENPSPADVKRVIQTAKASNLRTLLTDPQVGTQAFAAVAQDLKVQVSVFNSLETGGAEAMQPQAYLQTMRQNLQNLKSAFQVGTTQSRLGGGGQNQSGSLAPLGQPLAMQRLGWLQVRR
jgi:zinc transport system substrate-binding protein